LSVAIEDALRDTPVVVVNGARQTGKTTLVRAIARARPHTSYFTLDDPVVLAAARSDPDGFVAGLGGPTVIDEVQHAPGLFRAIKLSVDRDRRAGRFLLTGSADVLLLPTLSESLAGRADIRTLWPLAQVEIDRAPSAAFVDRLFSARLPRVEATDGLRADAIARLLRGGFPAVLRRAARRRAAWFDAYVMTILQRDVRDLAAIDGLTDMPRLFRLLAARVSSILNVAELSRSAAIPHSTLTRYLTLLETTFLLHKLPAWSHNLGKRLLKHPKVHLCDPGLAAHLQGIDSRRLERDPTLLGPLLEGFVAMELRKQLGWSRTRAALYHFGSVSGDEVDLVLERADGAVVGVEVKAAASLRSDELRGLRSLAALLGRKLARGVVLYLGPSTVVFDRTLCALPISALWTA
jgi:predicted AAA+ superfamily ATPase